MSLIPKEPVYAVMELGMLAILGYVFYLLAKDNRRLWKIVKRMRKRIGGKSCS